MELRGVFFVAFASLLTMGQTENTGVWVDIIACVQSLVDNLHSTEFNSKNNDTNIAIGERLSLVNLVSLICQNTDGFVGCLGNSLKDSNDSVTQVVGSLFNTKTVVQAYIGLCENISAISDSDGNKVVDCLSSRSVLSCQYEMADLIFYMGLVKKFASSDEQLSRNTMETLLCSLTSQRVGCEVRALKECNYQLGNVMETFYLQSRPEVCATTTGKGEQGI